MNQLPISLKQVLVFGEQIQVDRREHNNISFRKQINILVRSLGGAAFTSESFEGKGSKRHFIFLSQRLYISQEPIRILFICCIDINCNGTKVLEIAVTCLDSVINTRERLIYAD